MLMRTKILISGMLIPYLKCWKDKFYHITHMASRAISLENHKKDFPVTRAICIKVMGQERVQPY